jgi:hypothetical protein
VGDCMQSLKGIGCCQVAGSLLFWCCRACRPPKRGKMQQNDASRGNPCKSRGSVFIIASIKFNIPGTAFRITSPSLHHYLHALTTLRLRFAHGLAVSTELSQIPAHHLLPQWPNARTPSFSLGSKSGSTRPENGIRRA